jgi:chromosome partitioning protein
MIITIANQKGGCAKTTTAINLAAALAHLGKRTLLIDLDPQTHASVGLGVRSEKLMSSMYNVMSDRPDQNEFIENVIRPFSDNLDLAPGHVLLSTIEQEYVDKDQAIGKLKKIFENMVFPYEYIVIDCPPSLGFLTFNALFAADLAIVPIELGTFALYGVAKLLSMVELIRVKMSYSPQIFALPTMVDLRSKFAKNMMERIQAAFEANLLQTIIHNNVALRESQQNGIPVIAHKPESRASKDFIKLAKELLNKFDAGFAHEELEAQPAPQPHSRVKDFLFSSPKAGEVYLVGDFNQWRMDENSKLWDQGKGLWQKRMILPPGKYRYKFVVDGKWLPDPDNNFAEPNPYGGIDSVLEVD